MRGAGHVARMVKRQMQGFDGETSKIKVKSAMKYAESVYSYLDRIRKFSFL